MLDYKYPLHKYDEWFELLKDYVESNYAGAFVDIEKCKSGLHYESYRNLYDDDFQFSFNIVINSELYPRTKLYALLHEAGHIERMFEDRGSNTFFYKYFDGHPDNIKHRTRTVVEEVLAWHKAEKIANDLEIEIEERAWQREIERAIKLYIIWCAEKGEINDEKENED